MTPNRIGDFEVVRRVEDGARKRRRMLLLLLHSQLYSQHQHTCSLWKMTALLWITCVAALIATVVSQKKDICKRDNGFYPHEEYCDYFYECVDGVPYLQECPNGLAFAGSGRSLINHCDYAHKVGCPDEETGRVMGQPPRGTGHCPYLYGIYPHDKSCTRYWLCWNGTGTVQMCPFSLLYNEVEHACDWPEKVPGCQQHPLCKSVPNGVQPIQGSCTRYWLCMGGYPRLQRCPAGLAFAAESARCEWASNVPGCEPTPAPEDDERSLQSANSGSRRRGASDDEATLN